MRVRFYVTAKDIREAERTVVTCPVARSIKRRVQADRVMVASHPWRAVITWNYGRPQELRATYSLPHAVGSRVFAYDKERPIEPFSFTLEMPAGTPLS